MARDTKVRSGRPEAYIGEAKPRPLMCQLSEGIIAEDTSIYTILSMFGYLRDSRAAGLGETRDSIRESMATGTDYWMHGGGSRNGLSAAPWHGHATVEGHEIRITDACLQERRLLT